MIRTYLFLLFTVISFISNSQTAGFTWAKSVGVISTIKANSVYYHSTTNEFITGSFSGNVDFDPGNGVSTLISSGAEDIFVSKIDASGNFVWVKSFGGPGVDNGYGIVVDGFGDIYVTGHFTGTADFDPGVGVYNITSSGLDDIFICKLSSFGNFVWARSIGGAGIDNSFAISLDGSGNIFATGIYNLTADFDPGPGIFNLTSSGAEDIFILQINAAGNFVWAKSMGGSGSDNCNSIAIDGSGNIYTTGYFNGVADFDPGAAIYNITSAGLEDAFVNKLSAAGNFIWVKSMGGAGNDIARSISVTSGIYITGHFNGTSDFDPSVSVFNLSSAGNDDAFINKLDVAGNFIWAKSLGGSAGNEGGESIGVDGFNNVYTTGYYSNISDFNPSAGVYTLAPVGGNDVFISRLDPSGNFTWAKSMGGSGNDMVRSMIINMYGHIYTTGYFNSSGDFDPSVGITQLLSSGLDCMFLTKLDVSGSLYWANGMKGFGNIQPYSSAIDAAGNIYSTGYFDSESDFDPGAGVFSLSSIAFGDIFISKLDAAGNFVWAKSIGSSGVEACKAITVDAIGNVFITGAFTNTLDFDPGPGVYNLISVGQYDIFVCKLNASGNFVWAKSMGGSQNDVANSIVLDAAGNIYTTGSYVGLCDMDPGPNTNNLSSVSGTQDVFISKLDPSGNFVFAEGFGTNGTDYCYSIFLDAANNLLTTGSFQGTGDFDPGPGTFNLTSIGGSDVFISKLDASGNFVWAKTIAGSASSEEGSVVVVDNTGNVYTTGYFNGLVDFDPGPLINNLNTNGGADVYISKLDAAGNFIWAKNIGGLSSDYPYGLTLDGATNLYLAGIYSGSADFDPSSNNYFLNSVAGSYDAFTCKLDAAGNFLFANSFGGAEVDQPNALLLDNSNNILLTGYFRLDGDFDPGTNTYSLTASGNCDAFFVKLCQATGPTIVASGPVSFCQGGSVTLTSGAASSFSWSNGASTQSIVVSSSGNYAVTTPNSNGCTATSMVIPVSANPIPTISVNSGSICAGNSFSIIPSGANTYTISGGNTFVSPASTTSYSISGTNIFGCVSASQAICNVTVNALPLPTITVSGGTICIGQIFIFNPTGAFTYNYSSPTPFVSPTVSTSYSITGTDANGCVSAGPGISTVIVDQLPTVSNAGVSQTLCTTTTTLNGNTPTVGSGTWTLISGTGSITSSVNPSSILLGLSSGTNILQWTISNGVCASSISSVNVIVNVSPTINAVTSASIICAGSTATLNASGALTYSWNTGFNGSSIVVTPSTTTTYTVYGDNGLCSSFTAITQSVSLCTGLDQTNQQISLLILYPNPFQDEITIITYDMTTLSIINSLGEVIISKTVDKTSTINMSAFGDGIYYFIVNTTSKNKVFKMIKN